MELPSQVIFVTPQTKKSFEDLQKGKKEEKEIHQRLEEVFAVLEKNAFAGIQIQKKVIPKIYLQQHKIHNLWKYNLPDGWRLLYSIENQEGFVVSIIIEWLSHKEYERRFGY